MFEKSVDHFIPRSKCGSNYKKNKIICCTRCNKLKSDLLPDDFIAVVTKMIEQKTYGSYTEKELILIVKNTGRVIKDVARNKRRSVGYFVMPKLKDIISNIIKNRAA
jgi:hypothetical protein